MHWQDAIVGGLQADNRLIINIHYFITPTIIFLDD